MVQALEYASSRQLGGGYSVELQEVQESSFKYLDMLGVHPKRKWVSRNLLELPEDTFDYVMINHVMYCFDDKEYKEYLLQVKRILKKSGILIITAENLSELDCLKRRVSNNKLIRSVLRKNTKRVFWGYLRTIWYHRKLIKEVFNITRFGQLEVDGQMLDYSYYICKCR